MKLPMGKAVVLAHGLLGWGGRLARTLTADWTYFNKLSPLLQKHNLRLLAPDLRNGHPQKRAQRLIDAIYKWPHRMPDERVTVVAHSQGGLDARYAISCLDGASIIEKLITISTPHRGSSLCDAYATPAIALHPKIREMLDRSGIESEAAYYLSREYVAGEFNQMCPDVEGVSYYSFGGSRRFSHDYWGPFIPTSLALRAYEGENDGLVSVTSARWGEYVETLELDHVEQINFPLKMWRNDAQIKKLWGESIPKLIV